MEKRGQRVAAGAAPQLLARYVCAGLEETALREKPGAARKQGKKPAPQDGLGSGVRGTDWLVRVLNNIQYPGYPLAEYIYIVALLGT